MYPCCSQLWLGLLAVLATYFLSPSWSAIGIIRPVAAGSRLSAVLPVRRLVCLIPTRRCRCLLLTRSRCLRRAPTVTSFPCRATVASSSSGATIVASSCGSRCLLVWGAAQKGRGCCMAMAYGKMKGVERSINKLKNHHFFFFSTSLLA